MRTQQMQKNRSWMTLQNRSYSPNSFAPRGSNIGNNNVSVHSEHLWNMLEQVQLFPDQIHQLLRYEQRNLSNYKKAVEREKIKVNQQIEHLKKEMLHNIDDLKISIFAQLDRIYKTYMEKYATLKGEIVLIKKMRDQIQMDMDRRSNNYIPKYVEKKDLNDLNSKPSVNFSNSNIMKTLQKNNFEVKKFQMLNYISQLQREKIMPLNDLTKELIILTQYENGYFQLAEFQCISNGIVTDLKNSLRSIYQRKYEFIREPETICFKEEQPVLKGIYEENSSPFGGLNGQNGGQQDYRKLQSQPPVSKLQDFKVVALSPQQQNIGVQWAENVALQQVNSIKSPSEDIILCSVEVGKNLLAIGGKDGQINIYDTTSGQRVANCRGHKASICKLAIVSSNGKKYLASGSDIGCSSIVLWDIGTWNMRMRIQSHKAAVTAIVDLQDNRSMISGSYDKTINVYNLNNQGRILYNLPVNKTSVTAIILNSNASKMVSCGLDDTLNVWQIVRGSGRVVQTLFLERIIQNNTMICSLLSSALQPDIVLLGAKDGKIKLINIDKGEAYKTINATPNAVIQMVALERKTKPDFPIIACWPCNQECIKMINTESGKVTNIQTKGSIQFGCGIGPKAFFVNGGRNLAVLSQNKDKKQVNIFKLEIS